MRCTVGEISDSLEKVHGRHVATTLPPWHYHHDITTMTLPPWHYHHDTTTMTLPPWHYHHDTTTMTLPPWHYHHDTTTMTLPPWHYHHDYYLIDELESSMVDIISEWFHHVGSSPGISYLQQPWGGKRTARAVNTLGIPDSSCRMIWVFLAMRALNNVGRARASSNELVWRDWVPPNTAAIASIVVRMILLYGS